MVTLDWLHIQNILFVFVYVCAFMNASLSSDDEERNFWLFVALWVWVFWIFISIAATIRNMDALYVSICLTTVFVMIPFCNYVYIKMGRQK